VSVVEKTSFSLSFIRDVMAGSFAMACSVGQYAAMCANVARPKPIVSALSSWREAKSRELLVDDRPVQLAVGALVETVKACEDE
jgi:hypothetical protein